MCPFIVNIIRQVHRSTHEINGSNAFERIYFHSRSFYQIIFEQIMLNQIGLSSEKNESLECYFSMGRSDQNEKQREEKFEHSVLKKKPTLYLSINDNYS